MVSGQSELAQTVRDFKRLLSHYQQLPSKSARFPQFKRLLDAHFGVPEAVPSGQRPAPRGHRARKPLGKSQFSGARL